MSAIGKVMSSIFEICEADTVAKDAVELAKLVSKLAPASKEIDDKGLRDWVLSYAEEWEEKEAITSDPGEFATKTSELVVELENEGFLSEEE